MAFLTKLQVHGLVQLSLLLLSCYGVVGESIFSYSFISHAQPPHYMPGHPPVGAPKPHEGHHRHPHPPPPAKAPTPPPVKPPTPPVKPPTPPPHKPPTPPPSTPPVKPPTPPPSKPPSTPPVKPPTPPVKPPVKPPTVRKLVGVQGVVYCKSCKYAGINTLLGATPLANATVRLFCKNTKYHMIEDAKTDKNGYFLILPKKLTSAGAHKCKVFLLSSPTAKCSVPTNIRGGRRGAILVPAPKSPKSGLALFTVGPFAFEPSKKLCKPA